MMRVLVGRFGISTLDKGALENLKEGRLFVSDLSFASYADTVSFGRVNGHSSTAWSFFGIDIEDDAPSIITCEPRYKRDGPPLYPDMIIGENIFGTGYKSIEDRSSFFYYISLNRGVEDIEEDDINGLASEMVLDMHMRLSNTRNNVAKEGGSVLHAINEGEAWATFILGEFGGDPHAAMLVSNTDPFALDTTSPFYEKLVEQNAWGMGRPSLQHALTRCLRCGRQTTFVPINYRDKNYIYVNKAYECQLCGSIERIGT